MLLCLSAGYGLKRAGIMGEGSHLGLNAWLVYVAIPAAALLHVPGIDWTSRMVWPVVMPVLVWSGAWIFVRRLSSEQGPSKGALILGCGLGNTSFLGFPLTLAYFGEPGLKIAVVCDQITFLLLSTVGVAVSISHGRGSVQASLLKGLFRFPPFLGFLISLLAPGLVSYGPLPELWRPLAATIVPVALFSVGAQLQLSAEAFDRRLAWGLFYKLLLAPALMMGLFIAIGTRGLVAQVTVMEAGMASMATTSVLAVQYGLEARVINLLIGLGVPLSLLTSHLWYRLCLLTLSH